MWPVRRLARIAQALWEPFTALPGAWGIRHFVAGCEMLRRSRFTHRRPSFGISHTVVGDKKVAVTLEPALITPFATLLNFRKETDTPQHDVFITDWHNARDVPVSEGAFGFDDYTDHIIQFLETLGPNSHVIAVCQPCVQVIAAVAVMAEANHIAQPRSMTLMAGPVDTRINPTEVNRLATSQPIEWFEKNLISKVPYRLKGAGRRVYPGFLQTMAFLSMNRDRHDKAHRDLYRYIATGETLKANAIKTFYDEYFAVLDLPAEFYLETVQKVFQDTLLAKGELTYRGRRVDPAAIKRTALLTVEGERDDICAPGQTVAAHDLCVSLKPYMKRHHLQPGVGHYGVFSGQRWENQIYPIIRNLMLSTA
jgi:poly(3-hydroxybutyrate) depolymerase